MKIYTGYYGAMKAYKELFKVAISLSVPRWIGNIEMPNYRPLNPNAWMLKLEQDEYTEAYGRILSQVDYVECIEWLKAVSQEKDIVLLCYEKPPEFCHRQLVAEWINNHGAFHVIEFVTGMPSPEKKKYNLTQPELF